MAFEKYKGTNLAQGQLLSNIGASTLSFVLKTGQGDLFPSTFPFKVKIEKYSTIDGSVIKREIVKCTGKSGDVLTIVRSHEACPASDTALTQTTTAFSFDVDDYVFQVVTANTIEDIQDEVTRLETAKLNKAGGVMTGLLVEARSVSIASAATVDLSSLTGNTAHITGTTGITSFGSVVDGARFTLIFDGILTLTHHATNLILPTGANITTAVGDSMEVVGDNTGWRVVDYQRVNGEPLVAPTISKIKFGGTGVDGSISGALTITGSNNTYIEKNYTSFVPGANTVTITPTGCILHIKVSGNCDLTGTTFNFSGKGALGGSGGGARVGGPQDGLPGTNGTASLSTDVFHDCGPGTAGGGGTTTVNGAAGGAGTITTVVRLTNTQVSRKISIGPGAGGGGGGSGRAPDGGSNVPAGGNGGNGGGCVILEVAGNLTFSGTTINCSGANGATVSTASTGSNTGGSSGGGGGGGGVFLCLYNGALSGSVTPNVVGGSGGAGGAGTGTGEFAGGSGGGGASVIGNGTAGVGGGTIVNGLTGGAGANGVYLIEKNAVFS